MHILKIIKIKTCKKRHVPITQVANKMGITGNARRAFGKYIESYKKEVGKPGNANFSWEELIEVAKEFIER